MLSQPQIRIEIKKSNQISRPTSRNTSFLPEIVKTPSQHYQQKQSQSSIFNNSKGIEQMNSFKLNQLDQKGEQITSRLEIQRKELIRDIFRQDKRTAILKPLVKQQDSIHRSKQRKEDRNDSQEQQLKSILKRKSSNSKEHIDIFDFFEMEQQDMKPEQQKQNFRFHQHKQVSLQPIKIQEDSSIINTNKKIVSFNKQIQIKVIDPNEEKPKSNQKSFRRMYTVADLLDKS